MALGGKLVIETEIDNKSFDAQIEATRRKLELLEKSADETNIPKKFRRSKQEAQELEVEIEKTRNKLKQLQDQQNKTTDDGGKGWDFNLKNLKKFALGLVGIRGLYSLARRASSAWLSQDTELAKKFENVWLTLGAALAPVLEWLANAMQKLIGYLNVFIKALTGVDIIAKANAQALKKQAQATKELKNQTYGFDELNIQQEQTSSGSSGSSVGGVQTPELNEKVVKIIGDIGKGLGTIAQWVKDNLGTTGLITLGIVGLIGISAITGGSGLLGILAILLAIAAVVGALQEPLQMFKDNVEGQKEYNKTIEKTTTDYNELAKSGKMTREEQDKWASDLKTLNKGIDAHSDSLAKNNSMLHSTTAEQVELLKKTTMLVNSYETMLDTVGLTTETANDYLEALKNQREVVKNLGGDTSSLDKKIDTVRKNMGKLSTTKSTPEIDLKVTEKIYAEDKTGNVISQIAKKFSNVGINIASIVNNAVKNAALIDLIKTQIKQSVNFATGGVIHKSALGSIVNNPGRGVYLGSGTIAGEAGKEGVIPLTDPNTMAELGETIGKYITVNLTNITKLDSKTINKETKKVGNEMGFATNGGV